MQQVKDINSPDELPPLYIMFPDDVGAAVKRIDQIEEKLFSRGYKVIKPLRIFRWNDRSHYILAIELENKEDGARLPVRVAPKSKRNRYYKTHHDPEIAKSEAV